MPDELLKASEAARYLGVTRQRIYELASTGRLGQRVAGYWVFSVAELDQYRQRRGDNLGGRPKHEQRETLTSDSLTPRYTPPEALGKFGQYVQAALGYAAVQPLPSGKYVGASLDFPELGVVAPTRAECTNLLQSDLERLIREKIRLGQPLPTIDGLTLTADDMI